MRGLSGASALDFFLACSSPPPAPLRISSLPCRLPPQGGSDSCPFLITGVMMGGGTFEGRPSDCHSCESGNPGRMTGRAAAASGMTAAYRPFNHSPLRGSCGSRAVRKG